MDRLQPPAVLLPAVQVRHGPVLPPWQGIEVTAGTANVGEFSESWFGLAVEGTSPMSVSARVDPAAPLPPEGYTVRVWADDTRCHLDAVAATPRGLRHAYRTVQALLAAGTAVETAITDQPAVVRRGFLECFYGPAWSEADRHTMIVEAAAWGMNAYCYGPSGDAQTGARWRLPYAKGKREEFSRLTALGARHGVEICWRVSPSAPLSPEDGIVLSDADEVSLLLTRIDDVLDTGVSTVLLTFDDVEHGLFHEADRVACAGDPHPVAAAHASLASAVGRRLADRGATLVVCPTRYWGTGADSYNNRLTELIGARLGPVEFCWTGPRVTSTRITANDAAAAAERHLGHPLFLWDNFPVNDWDAFDTSAGAPALRRLFLSPMRGRDAAVADHLGSYLINCGAQPLAALPVLATAAQWAWNPTDYDPDRAWQAAVDRIDPHGEWLPVLATVASTSPLQMAAPHPLAVNVFRYLAGDVSAAAVQAPLDEMRKHLTGMPVGLELQGWSNDLVLQLDAADAALRAIEAHRTGDSAGLARAAQWLAEQRQRLDSPFPSAVLDGALTPLIERGRGLAGAPVPPHDV